MRILSIFVAVFVLMGCTTHGQSQEADNRPAHHTSEGFKNLYIDDGTKSFFSFMRMKYFGGYEWADQSKTVHLVPQQKLDLGKVQNPDPDVLQVSWLGHSTFLIQKDGVNILTDPVFGNRVSPVSFAGPERMIPHVVKYEDLPKIHFVVISHNHYDHLDVAAVRQLGNVPQYMVPLKLKPWYEAVGVDGTRVIEYDWWDQKSFGNVVIEALPSQHWSARGLFDRRNTLWASWSISIAGEKVWFAGDTGYNDIQFKEIGEKSGPFDLALIPIGAYEPRSFMKRYHINPQEAVQVHRDVRAHKSFGMHWGTFQLTAEDTMAPVEELAKQKSRYNLEEDEFTTMAVGETFALDVKSSQNLASRLKQKTALP